MKCKILLTFVCTTAVALMFVQSASALGECDCTLDPLTTYITRGVKLEVDVTVTNNTGWAGNLYFAAKMLKPDATTTGWVTGPVGFPIAAYGSHAGHFSYDVPTSWPVGTYKYLGFVGIPGVAIYCAYNFDFVVAGVGVPKTGQTGSWATGDDGDLQMGMAWPNPRFTDNGDGTVKDNLTGLIWLKDANCIATTCPGFDNDGTPGDGAVVWQHALDFMDAITIGGCPECGAGYSDWRLPNVRELQSLIDYGQSEPALPSSHPFNNVQSDNYWWSSTTFEDFTTSAWCVDVRLGSVGFTSKASSFYFVWPVRGGN